MEVAGSSLRRDRREWSLVSEEFSLGDSHTPVEADGSQSLLPEMGDRVGRR